jgi:hypothetical protein
VAAGFYRSEQRATADVDYLVAWDDRLVPGLIDAGFDVRVLPETGEPDLIRVRRADGLADLIVARTAYQDLALVRAADHVLTVEDVLIHKLIAWRPRDRDDIRSILSTGIAYDSEYVNHWGAEWGVEDRWREALASD